MNWQIASLPISWVQEFVSGGFVNYEILIWKTGNFSLRKHRLLARKKILGMVHPHIPNDGIRKRMNINNMPKYIKAADNQLPMEIRGFVQNGIVYERIYYETACAPSGKCL